MEKCFDIEMGSNQLLRIQRKEFQGRENIDIRQWWRTETSKDWMPSKKGVNFPLTLLDKVLESISQLKD